MKKLTFLILMAVVILSLTFCNKDRTEVQLKTTYTTPQSFLDSHKPQEQEFVITDSGSAPIIGQEGTVIYQSKSIFMYPNGDTITYPYTIKLVELYKPSDMVYYGVFPVDDGKLLKSSGEIRVRAFKDGQELVLRPGHYFMVYFPAFDNKSYFLYTGENVNGTIDWDQTTTTSTYVFDTISGMGENYHKFFSTYLNWINADYFADSATCQISFVSSTDSVETIPKFLYFPYYNAVMEVFPATVTVPQNTPVKFLALGYNSDGELYYYYQEFTTSPGTTINITMSGTTENYITQLLDGWGQ